MKKRILLCTVGATVIAALFCGCAAVFQPTETYVYGGSSLINSNKTSSAVFDNDTTSTVSSVSSESSAESSSTVSAEPLGSSPELSSEIPEPSTPAAPTPFARHPRFLKLEEQLSHDAKGKMCLSEDEAAFAETSLFVGDSICRGFTAYNVIKAKNVYAAGSVGARNFFDMEFHYYGEPTEYSNVLEQAKPENVFLSMGMNDVNMTSAAEYCENYRKLIDFTLEHSSAKVYVCAITPISSNFTDRSRIDGFNLAMKNFISKNFGQRVAFIDFGYLLKNSDNKLSSGLDSGDGIHLAPECYYIAIKEICKQLEIEA